VKVLKYIGVIKLIKLNMSKSELDSSCLVAECVFAGWLSCETFTTAAADGVFNFGTWL
jgi:hypothetical protein